MSPREMLIKAKVDHYLERAEECVREARYLAARKSLTSVMQLDASNKMLSLLEQEVESSLYDLSHRSNGHSVPQELPQRRKLGLVLIVDQDERLLSSFAMILRSYGFDVIAAASYEEALETLEAITPDVIVSEVNFENGPRGFDLYHRLKSAEHGLDIPFVFLTARLDREMLIAGKRFGVDDFLLKPVDADLVAASIQSCLARRRKIREN